MKTARRRTLRLTALLAPVAVGAALLAPGPAAADEVPAVSVAVEGRVERVVVDRARTADTDTFASVVTADGERLPVTEASVEAVDTGSTVTAETVLPESVVEGLLDDGTRLREGQVLSATSRAGSTAVDELVSAGDPVALDIASVAGIEPGQVAEADVLEHRQMFVVGVTNVPGAAGDPAALRLDEDALRAHAEVAGAYWSEQSGDALGFIDPEVRRTALAGTLPSVAQGCGFRDHATMTRVLDAAEAAFPGVDFTGDHGRHLVIVLPAACAGSGVGLGSVGHSLSADGWSMVVASDPLDQVLVHEIGHNLGLGHANLQQCVTSCRTVEYHDLYSPMGLSVCFDASCGDGVVTDGFRVPALGTSHRHHLDGGDEPLVVLDGPTTVELTARGAAGATGVEFNVPWSDRTYVVEWRDGAGADAASYYGRRGASSKVGDTYHRPGVTFGFHESTVPGFTTTLFAEPAGSTAWTGALTAGSSMIRDGVRVTVTSVSGPSATVRLDPVPGGAVAAPVVRGPKVGLPAGVELEGWPAGSSLSYVWTVGGKRVSTSSSFTPRPGDVGKALLVTVTAAPRGGELWPTFSKTSASVKVAPGTLKSPVPTISGTAKVGKTLTVTPHPWTKDTKVAVQWYADGKKISKATKRSLKLTKSQRGKRITVTVTGTKTGYTTVTRTSAKTAAVKK